MQTKQKFGLFTSICMIVGIVIGSGIFFKSSAVLMYTNGNVMLGVVAFAIAAIAIVFGSLALAELSIRTEKEGGIVAYAEKFVGKKVACVFGWFQNLIYFPSIIAIVAWVSGMFIGMLFDFNKFEYEMLVAVIVIIIFYIMNYISAKASGIFQNSATIIKLMPLFLFAIVGVIWGEPNFTSSIGSQTDNGNFFWLAALVPVVFAYDGWIVATGLSHEIKNSRRNLYLALIIAPLFILCAYVFYFVGASMLVGPEQMVELGNGYVFAAATKVFGAYGAKVFLVFVIISILGTVNGLILGHTRGLYALGRKGMLPFDQALSHISAKYDTPTKATLTSVVMASLWLVIHYIVESFELLAGSDISEISIVTMYLLFIVLYVQVMRLRKSGEITSNVRGYVIPVLATIGSLIIFICGWVQNIQNENGMRFWYYIAFSAVVLLIAYSYANTKLKPSVE